MSTLNCRDWVKLVGKMLMVLILSGFVFVGAILILQPEWNAKNWVDELHFVATQNPKAFWIISIGVITGWLWANYLIFEQMYLKSLTLMIVQKSQNLANVAQLPRFKKSPFIRLRPLIKSIDGIFEAMQESEARGNAIEQSKDEIIGNISHDLRTPLTALLGYLGLVKMHPGAPENNKYVNVAYEKADHMRTLVEDLYEYVQVNDKSFKMQLHLAPLNLSAMLSQLAVNYELEAQEHHVEISAATQPDSIEMYGDQNRLARVFMNLIANAFKYGEGATYIHLTARILDDDESVEVCVENDGKRIPEEALGHVFERFYRVESSRNVKTGGSGLGLAIVSGIVEGHNGEARVESDEHKTSFIITLPLQPDL